MKDKTRPHGTAEDCYWVEPGKLLAGGYPTDLKWLAGNGVSAFIDLTQDGELPNYSHRLSGATHQRFPIREGRVPSRELTSDCLDAIDENIGQGRTVYVHCMGGTGRTGIIIGCWLIRHGYNGRETLARLQELRQKSPTLRHIPSPVTQEQARHVLGWEEGW